ncbi:MAG TPA: ribonuclease P [Methanocorpusculum sp.]|nr:ribonuclease P [Methanocorpusculum sp.]
MAKFEKGVLVKQIARERIEILFAETQKNPKFAHRYIYLAREMSMKQRVRLTKSEKAQFCHVCGTYLVPGKTLTVRIQNGKVIRTCHVCDSISRIPLEKQKNR